MQYPKDFSLIASFLTNKSPQDCVSFYYNTKPTAEFKQKLKAQSIALRRRSARNGWALAVQAFGAIGYANLGFEAVVAHCVVAQGPFIRPSPQLNATPVVCNDSLICRRRCVHRCLYRL